MRLTENLDIALDKINRSASATDKSECYKLDQLQTEVKLPTAECGFLPWLSPGVDLHESLTSECCSTARVNILAELL